MIADANPLPLPAGQVMTVASVHGEGRPCFVEGCDLTAENKVRVAAATPDREHSRGAQTAYRVHAVAFACPVHLYDAARLVAAGPRMRDVLWAVRGARRTLRFPSGVEVDVPDAEAVLMGACSSCSRLLVATGSTPEHVTVWHPFADATCHASVGDGATFTLPTLEAHRAAA